MDIGTLSLLMWKFQIRKAWDIWIVYTGICIFQEDPRLYKDQQIPQPTELIRSRFWD